MADRRNVIYSIERCICHVPDACRDCGYDNEPCPKCFEHLLRDAHDLLKAQEPRVMNAAELRQYLMVKENGLLSHDQWKELGQRAPLYIEFRRPDEFQVNWRTAEHLRQWAMESMFWDNYGKDRRCWTSRPTDEQREAVKWE